MSSETHDRTTSIEQYIRSAQQERSEALRAAFVRLGIKVKSIFTEPELSAAGRRTPERVRLTHRRA